MEERRARINVSTKTKSLLYKQWNPTLAVHDVYVTRKHFPEHWRIAWSRFRLGGTDLPCEKSRWSKTENETVCRCGGVLSETHILLQCPDRLTNINSLAELFGSDDQRNVMKCIFDTLEKYESDQGHRDERFIKPKQLQSTPPVSTLKTHNCAGHEKTSLGQLCV